MALTIPVMHILDNIFRKRGPSPIKNRRTAKTVVCPQFPKNRRTAKTVVCPQFPYYAVISGAGKKTGAEAPVSISSY